MRVRLLAITLILLSSPAIFLTAIACLICQGRPILFRQNRAGLEGQTFQIWKFRTMFVESPDPKVVGRVSFDGLYVTPLGRWLRRLRLDELPQLFNIAHGDMTFVGPRPCLIDQVGSLTPSQYRRLRMRPGLTGLAEVCGNVLLTQEEQFALDTLYLDVRDHNLDCWILLATTHVVIFGPKRREEWIQRAMERMNTPD